MGKTTQFKNGASGAHSLGKASSKGVLYHTLQGLYGIIPRVKQVSKLQYGLRTWGFRV